MLDSLRKEEISSLDPALRGGWTPVVCMIDTIDGAIFRIDTKTTLLIMAQPENTGWPVIL